MQDEASVFPDHGSDVLHWVLSVCLASQPWWGNWKRWCGTAKRGRRKNETRTSMMSSSFDRNVMDCHTDFSCHINLIKRLKTSWGQTKFTWLQNKCRSCSDLSHFENKVVLGLRSKVVYGCRNLSTTLIVITVYF